MMRLQWLDGFVRLLPASMRTDEASTAIAAVMSSGLAGFVLLCCLCGGDGKSRRMAEQTIRELEEQCRALASRKQALNTKIAAVESDKKAAELQRTSVAETNAKLDDQLCAARRENEQLTKQVAGEFSGMLCVRNELLCHIFSAPLSILRFFSAPPRNQYAELTLTSFER